MTAAILRMPLILMLAASLASCVPMRHVVHLRPAVTGFIAEDGKAVPGVELFLARFPGTNQPCTEVGEIIPVTPEGGFSWPPDEESKLMDSLIDPVSVRGTLTVLCIRHPAKGVLIGAVLSMRQDKPLSLRLACDVALPRSSTVLGRHITSTMLGQAQHCEAATAEST